MFLSFLFSLKQGLTAAVKDKLNELQEWVDMMNRRREGDDQIGPDSMTIKKQITEMSVSFVERFFVHRNNATLMQ